MTTNDIKIDAYLRRVRAGLSGLPNTEVTDILNELRAHIVERAESGEGSSDGVVEAVLRSMGTPEQISALYVSENLTSLAESNRTPWTILRSVFHWATLSVVGFAVFMVCLIGYSIGVCFLLAAFMKPFHPQGVGLWYSSPESGQFSLHLGGFTPPTGTEQELLGWWLVPIGCSLGGGTTLLTTQFALWSLRRLRKSRSTKFL
jgi:hypothetical protein